MTPGRVWVTSGGGGMVDPWKGLGGRWEACSSWMKNVVNQIKNPKKSLDDKVIGLLYIIAFIEDPNGGTYLVVSKGLN
jgi:hypothetical protein